MIIKRYVDCIFGSFLPNKIDLITNELNSYNLNIKYTCNLESNNKLAFLDECITSTGNNEVETSVYSKETKYKYLHKVTLPPFFELESWDSKRPHKKSQAYKLFRTPPWKQNKQYTKDFHRIQWLSAQAC